MVSKPENDVNSGFKELTNQGRDALRWIGISFHCTALIAVYRMYKRLTENLFILKMDNSTLEVIGNCHWNLLVTQFYLLAVNPISVFWCLGLFETLIWFHIFPHQLNGENWLVRNCSASQVVGNNYMHTGHYIFDTFHIMSPLNNKSFQSFLVSAEYDLNLI